MSDAFWSNVEKTESCWLWTASCFPNGYGEFRVGRRHHLAHRVAYELLVGPIPDGLKVDHLCRVRRCVNPAHLEPVSERENIMRGVGPTAHHARQTHCKRGHLFDEKNTIRRRRRPRERECRTCKQERARHHYRLAVYAEMGVIP